MQRPDPALFAMFHAFSVLQEKWVLFILYELTQGPIGFNEMTRRGPINTTTLSQRLDLLEQEGIVTRTVHSTIPPKTSYQLTEKGWALKPILETIRRWADQHVVVEARDCASPEVICEADPVEDKAEFKAAKKPGAGF
jgi:DNA-binding HxlR family transcriptional regulator